LRGNFKFSYNGSFIEKFEQKAGGVLMRAYSGASTRSAANTLKATLLLACRLIGQDGNQEPTVHRPGLS